MSGLQDSHSGERERVWPARLSLRRRESVWPARLSLRGRERVWPARLSLRKRERESLACKTLTQEERESLACKTKVCMRESGPHNYANLSRLKMKKNNIMRNCILIEPMQNQCICKLILL